MSSPIASSSSSNTHSPPSEDASSSLPPPIPSTSSDGTSTSTSLLSGSTLPQPKKNRNKKSLVLGAAAAKPGTLSGLEGGSLLAGTANTGTGTGVGVPHARPPPRRPAPIQVSARRGPSSLPTTPTPAASSSSSEYHNKLSEQLATLELGVEFKLDLREEDLTRVEELGAGNGGTVERVKHGPTGIMMAKKTIHLATSLSIRKQILRELQILHDCNSPWIVGFYGAYLLEGRVVLLMEFMDKGSLDRIYRLLGPIPEPILGSIARAVVEGLCYLYERLGVMHRDVKPSNILLNSAGQIKICDFGVSGELINSVADTFVGTSTYMSPERISGDPYTVKSDVWSLGITLVELALGRFPFSSAESDSDSDREEGERTLATGKEKEGEGEEETLSPVPKGRKEEALQQAEERRRRQKSKSSRPQGGAGGGSMMSILELLQYIVNEPPPSLPSSSSSSSYSGGSGGKGLFFSPDACNFVDQTLRKEPIGWNVRKKGPLPEGVRRPTPRELLDHPWMLRVKREEVEMDLKQWAAGIP